MGRRALNSRMLNAVTSRKDWFLENTERWRAELLPLAQMPCSTSMYGMYPSFMA